MVSELFAMREQQVEPPQEFMEELAKLHRTTRGYFSDATGSNQ
jgi:hypothetical protein